MWNDAQYILVSEKKKSTEEHIYFVIICEKEQYEKLYSFVYVLNLSERTGNKLTIVVYLWRGVLVTYGQGRKKFFSKRFDFKPYEHTDFGNMKHIEIIRCFCEMYAINLKINIKSAILWVNINYQTPQKEKKIKSIVKYQTV